MVRTTLELKDEIYKKLVNEAIEKYGNTKNLSRVINESLEVHMSEKEHSKPQLSKEEIKRRGEILKKTFGSWKTKETGAEYQRRMRKEWAKRSKRLGI